MPVTLTLEDGSGIAEANSYGDVSGADTYWGNMPQRSESVAWLAATEDTKKGSLIEATLYTEANYKTFYLGTRKDYDQGLEWPRTFAEGHKFYGVYEDTIPPELKNAIYELAGRAVSSSLSVDVAIAGGVKRLKLKGPDGLEKETEYFGSSSQKKVYGSVLDILSSLLNGSQEGAVGGWAFSFGESE